MYYSADTNPIPSPKEVATRAKAEKDKIEEWTPDALLANIIRYFGKSCTYLTARNHLKEDGYSLTQAQFDRAYAVIYPPVALDAIDALFKGKGKSNV